MAIKINGNQWQLKSMAIKIMAIKIFHENHKQGGKWPISPISSQVRLNVNLP